MRLCEDKQKGHLRKLLFYDMWSCPAIFQFIIVKLSSRACKWVVSLLHSWPESGCSALEALECLGVELGPGLCCFWYFPLLFEGLVGVE